MGNYKGNILKLLIYYKYYIKPCAVGIPVCIFGLNQGFNFFLFRPTFIFVFASAIIVFEALVQRLLEPHIKDLESQIKGLQSTLSGEKQRCSFYTGLWHTTVKAVLDETTRAQLDFTHNDRVTIYIFDHVKNTFVPVVRHSQNPELAKPGRTQYPPDQGCIKVTWEHGLCFDNDLWTSKNGAYKKEKLTMYNLTQEVVDSVTMKSRLFSGKRLPSKGPDHLAVVVIESLDDCRLTKETLNLWFDQNEDFILAFIRGMKDNIPKPSTAEKGGL